MWHKVRFVRDLAKDIVVVAEGPFRLDLAKISLLWQKVRFVRDLAKDIVVVAEGPFRS